MTMFSHTPAWCHLSGRRSVSRSARSTVSNRKLKSRSNCLSRGCSSSPARKFDRAFLVITCSLFRRHPCIVSSHHLHSIALSRILYPHWSPTFFLSRPPLYPTDNVASNDGTPGSYELLTTSPRPDLYALLSAPCTHSATTLFRRCSHPLSSSSYIRCIVSSAPSQASAMPRQKCFISLSGLVVPSFSLPLYILCVIEPSSSLLSKNFRLSSPPHQGLVVDCLYHFVLPSSLLFSLIPLDLYIQSRV